MLHVRRAAEKENELAVDELEATKEDYFDVRRSLAHSTHLEKALEAKIASIKETNDKLEKRLNDAQGVPEPEPNAAEEVPVPQVCRMPPPSVWM
jgi:hypothetical protein